MLEEEKPIDPLEARSSTSPSYSRQKVKESSETPSDSLCEGDTVIIDNVVPDMYLDHLFEGVRDEVLWQKMSHQGGEVPRLVSVQTKESDDGSIPTYRHPADESPPSMPFTPLVSLIKKHVEKTLGHEVNHVLIQLYRDGADHISEHSDKTLDIVPDTFIANVSLGAQRTMVFRTKKQSKNNALSNESDVGNSRRICRAALSHNSMCKMGLETNRKWLHSIRQDKRALIDKRDAEISFNGVRISLTFRSIGTYLNSTHHIWGQGATSKTRANAKRVINGDTPETRELLRAFGKENQSSDLNRVDIYDKGFDVLHISNTRKLYFSADEASNNAVQFTLAEFKIEWTKGRLSAPFKWNDFDPKTNSVPNTRRTPITFVDNDVARSTVTGYAAITLYIDTFYGIRGVNNKSQADLARQYTRFQQAQELCTIWHAQPVNGQAFDREVRLWAIYASQNSYIAGDQISIADFAFFAAIWETRKSCAVDDYSAVLAAYLRRMEKERSIVGVLGPVLNVRGLKTEETRPFA